MKANPNYRVEHVATAPRGWKVRTKMQATHMLRIAFPPGRRRRGAGKVVEIFHPVNENPCAMRNAVSAPQTAAERRARLESLSREDLLKLARSARITAHRIESHSELVKLLMRRTGPPHLRENNPDTRAAKRQTRERAVRIRSARLSNPSATESAAALYESFHGKSPREILEMQESDAARHTYTALGDLRELMIDAPAGKVKIGFDGSDAVKVASAPGGKQLYLIGGNQNLDSQLGRFGSDPSKDFVELGAATQITYQTRKSMDNFTLVDYYHNLGEETNEPPFAFYDRLKHRIFLAGGRYRVEAPGIIN